MKKIIYCLALIATVFSSCDKEENPTIVTDEAALLPKKVIETSNGTSYVSTCTYDGKKLLNISNEDGKTVFTYSGDYIAKVQGFDADNVLEYTEEYTYENGKLKTEYEFEEGAPVSTTTTYTHNLDGTIVFEKKNKNLSTGVETMQTPGKYTYLNGNLVKEEFFSTDYSRVVTYEYDTKINPLKNILGFNKLLGQMESVNNEQKKTIVSTNNGTINTNIYTFQYTYNDKGYVLEKKDFNNSGNLTGTTTFEY